MVTDQLRDYVKAHRAEVVFEVARLLAASSNERLADMVDAMNERAAERNGDNDKTGLYL